MSLLLPVALCLSALLCGIYLQIARRWQFLDHPNDRSSHHRPTPHGGGVPLLVSFACMIVLASVLGMQWSSEYWWMLGIALLLMALGVLDDALRLSVRLRFAIYALCCALAVAVIFQPLEAWLWWLLFVPATLALLWGLNLYNFMDGIDGIAAVQGFMACCTAGLLAFVYQDAREYALFCLLFGFCQLGFLAWNLPPARLFMGDAGSIPSGFVLGALALVGEVSGVLPAASWLILLAVFITDASWTLLRRIFSGVDFTQAHREHLYQRLSRRWNSHLAVDLALLAIMAFWLFPLAFAAQTFQRYQIFHVILAYLPLLICMAKTRRMT